MNVRIVQIDGALPNLALMRLASWHRSRGDTVCVTRSIEPDLFEPVYDRVYGSAIFRFSADRVDRFLRAWPSAIVGGTGTDSTITVEDVVGEEWLASDYTGHDVDYSLGFTQRGCRLKCKFCVVPAKEGKNRGAATVAEIWRGDPWPRKLHLLDNDFFGQPREDWQARIAEIREGGFRVCMSQGINLRLIDADAAAALASIEYRDADFSRRKLYTAWDNLRDERAFFRGVDVLEAAGIPPTHLRVYMLIGFDATETWERRLYRFNRMVERGMQPYPMVFNNARTDLKAFQRWAVMGLYRTIPWGEYRDQRKTEKAA